MAGLAFCTSAFAHSDSARKRHCSAHKRHCSAHRRHWSARKRHGSARKRRSSAHKQHGSAGKRRCSAHKRHCSAHRQHCSAHRRHCSAQQAALVGTQAALFGTQAALFGTARGCVRLCLPPSPTLRTAARTTGPQRRELFSGAARTLPGSGRRANDILYIRVRRREGENVLHRAAGNDVDNFSVDNPLWITAAAGGRLLRGSRGRLCGEV